MAEFISESRLNAELESIFDVAEEVVFLISPYIKLHERLKSKILTLKEREEIQIVIVFGKNKRDITKSMGVDDFNLLKDFPNIEIRYEERLHAKYYANERIALLTSMNLYSYSQNNNIEFGVLLDVKNWSDRSLDREAYTYFKNVIKQSELLFERKPTYESRMFGLSERYVKSETETDKLSELFLNKKGKHKSTEKISEAKNSNLEVLGYCIRTGEKIPFNVTKPYTDKAFKSWERYKNEEYAEKYCHFSGELSNGETCFSKPILRKNWKEAKKVHKL